MAEKLTIDTCPSCGHRLYFTKYAASNNKVRADLVCEECRHRFGISIGTDGNRPEGWFHPLHPGEQVLDITCPACKTYLSFEAFTGSQTELSLQLECSRVGCGKEYEAVVNLD